MLIRKAEPADFEAMAAIWLDASRAAHGFLGEAVLQEQLGVVRDIYFPQADNWVAIQDGVVLGFIGLLESHVGGLFVRPSDHQRGVGRQLLEHAATRLGRLTVDVYERNVGAVAFYTRCGFSVVGRKERDDEGRPFPLLQMVRSERSTAS